MLPRSLRLLAVFSGMSRNAEAFYLGMMYIPCGPPTTWVYAFPRCLVWTGVHAFSDHAIPCAGIHIRTVQWIVSPSEAYFADGQYPETSHMHAFTRSCLSKHDSAGFREDDAKSCSRPAPDSASFHLSEQPVRL